MTTELLDNDPAIAVPGGQQYAFPPVFYPGVSDYAVAGIIQLTAGQTVLADIPLTRQPYFNVEIPVANPDPNINFNVAVSMQGHRGSIYTLGYNAEKQRIEGLLPTEGILSRPRRPARIRPPAPSIFRSPARRSKAQASL